MNSGGKVLLLLLAACFLSLGASAFAADNAKTTQAIHGGQQYLRDTQYPDGHWNDDYEGRPYSATGFAVAALLETGLPASDPTIIKGVQYILSSAQWDGTYTELGGGSNYDHSACLIALSNFASASNPASLTITDIIRSAKAYTLHNQYLGNNDYKGSWTYNGNGEGDNSNTQFAVMGLWYASRFLGDSTSTTDAAWAQNLLLWLNNVHYVTDAQNNYAVFLYYPGSTYSFIGGPMTASGLWSLGMIGQDQNPMANEAEEWFAADGTYRWDATPGPYYSGGRGSYYYFLFGMAKALTATVGYQNTLGTPKRPWAQDFTNQVVDSNALWTTGDSQPDGLTRVHWTDNQYLDGGNILDTSWMLMALAFVSSEVEKKDALIPDPPDADFPILGLITLSVKGDATISRATRRKIGPEKTAQSVTLPIGATEFTINHVAVGGTVVLYIKLPDAALDPTNPSAFVDANGNLKAGLNWFKIQNGAWKGQGSVPIVIDRVAKEIQVTLRDGGPEDNDGLRNGSITDPGAPGYGGDGAAPASSAQQSFTSGTCFLTTLFSAF